LLTVRDVVVFHERIAPMPSTAPLDQLIRRHDALAAWLASS